MKISDALQLHHSGRFDEAESVCVQILRADPDNAVAEHLLGRIAFEANRKKDAVCRLQRAFDLNPVAPEVGCDLAAAFGEMGNHEAAVATLQKYLTLHTTSARGHNNLGVALEHLGRLEDAVKAYKNAIHLAPGRLLQP